MKLLLVASVINLLGLETIALIQELQKIEINQIAKQMVFLEKKLLNGV